MSRGLAIDGLPAEQMRGMRLVEEFWNKASMLRNRWTLTNNPLVDQGITCDGVNQKAEYAGLVNNVQSVSFWITLSSTTEDILQLSAAHSIEVAAGTLTATGWTAPTIYVNGVATATITTARSFVTVTTANPFDADDIAVGEVAAYGDLKMEDLKVWANGCVLTLQEALDYTNNATWNWENKLLCNLQFRHSDYDPTNVQTLDSSGYGNHAQLGDGSTATTFPAQGDGRMTFDGGDYLVIPADATLPAGTYTVLMALKIGVLDATWDYLFDARAVAGTGYATISDINQWEFSSGNLYIDGLGPYATATQSADAGLHTIAVQGITLDITSILAIFSRNDFVSNLFGTLFDFEIAPGTLTPTQINDYHQKMLAVVGAQV